MVRICHCTPNLRPDAAGYAETPVSIGLGDVVVGHRVLRIDAVSDELLKAELNAHVFRGGSLGIN